MLIDKCCESISDYYENGDRGDEELINKLCLLKPEIPFDYYNDDIRIAEAVDLFFALDSFRPKEDGGYGLSLKYSPDRKTFIICVFSDYV